jgi:hypothetical protein
MGVLGRILLATSFLIGAVLLAMGIICLVAADSIADDLNQEYNNDIGYGVIRVVGAGEAALGLILLAVSSISLFRRHRLAKSHKNKRT